MNIQRVIDMKKIANMCLIILTVIFALVCMQSCSNTDPDAIDTTGSGDVTNEDTSSDSPGYDPKKYEKMYSDKTVYNTNMYTGYSVYFNLCDPDNPMNQTIGEVLLDSPGEAMYAHEDPTCKHHNSKCPMWDSGISKEILVVDPDYREQPLVYFFCRHHKEVYVDGDVNGDSKFRVFTEVREYDVETGEFRSLATVPFNYVADAWCYQGKLYISTIWGSMEYSEDFGVIDLSSGEFKKAEIDDCARMLGITNDRVWYITGSNVIGSCTLDLADYRNEYDVGVTTLRINGEFTLKGYAQNGVIYFERNCRVPQEVEGDAVDTFYMVSDIYALDADDIESGETLIVEGARAFDAYNGDLYFTKIDYKEFGEMTLDGGEHTFMARSYDGGTLYKYDHETDETSVCYSDIGTGIEDNYIFEVTGDYVIFTGLRYRDFETCKLWDGRDNLCIADLNTGEWQVLYPYDYMED